MARSSDEACSPTPSTMTSLTSTRSPVRPRRHAESVTELEPDRTTLENYALRADSTTAERHVRVSAVLSDSRFLRAAVDRLRAHQAGIEPGIECDVVDRPRVGDHNVAGSACKFNDSDRDAVDVPVSVHEPGRAFNVVLGGGEGSQPWLVVHEPQPRGTEVGAGTL